MVDYVFGVRDLKVAKWISTGNYDTPQDVAAVSQFNVAEQTTNAELNGDDQTVAVHAKSRVAQITATFGFLDLEVYEVMTGAVLVGPSGDADEVAVFDARNYPYVGLCAKIQEVNETGTRLIWVPKAKITSGFNVNNNYGQFAQPSITLEAVKDGVQGIWRIYNYDHDVDPDFPPG